MSLYFSQNLLMLALCLCAFVMLKHAPARLRFYVCLLAISCWLVPWPLLSTSLPVIAEFDINLLPTLNLPDLDFNLAQPTQEVISSTAPAWQFSWSWPVVIASVLAVGIVLFIKDIVNYVSLQSQWLADSYIDNSLWQQLGISTPPCDIRRISGQGRGMLTGIIRPTIWLDSNLQDQQQLQLILRHEFTHLQQHDHHWLWLITLVQRLCWWNPMVWLMAHYARQQMELSCDEQCKTLMPIDHYQTQLIELILANQHNSPYQHTVLSMGFKSKFNLKRINYLNEDRTMKLRHKMIMLLLAAASTFTVLSTNATDNNSLTTQSTAAFDWSIAEPVGKLIEAGKYAEVMSILEPLLENRKEYKTKAQEYLLHLSATSLLLGKLDVEQGFLYANEYLALLKDSDTTKYTSQLSIFGQLGMFVGEEHDGFNIALKYFKEYTELATSIDDKSATMMAYTNYVLQQYQDAELLLRGLINKAENNGETPQENWLKLLASAQNETGQQGAMAETFSKLAGYYPTAKNIETLQKMTAVN